MGTVKCENCVYLMRTSMEINGDCSAINYPYLSDIEAAEDHEAAKSSRNTLHINFCGAFWLKLPGHTMARSGTMVDAQAERKCKNFKKKK